MKLQPPCPSEICNCGYTSPQEGGRFIFHGRRITLARLSELDRNGVLRFCWENNIDPKSVLDGNKPLGICRKVMDRLKYRLDNIANQLQPGGPDEEDMGFHEAQTGDLFFED